jgi:uncharacterized surface protein with fasciclin (FAS1) repeats
VKTKNYFKNFVGILSLTGGTLLIGMPVMAQFFYPSSSFFQPAAFYLENGQQPNLSDLLDETNSTTFSSLLTKANLSDALEKEKPLTIFAPTNAALAALSPAIEKKLSEPKNLEKLLKYHVVKGVITEKEIKNRQIATKLEGSSLKIVGVPVGNKIGIKINEATASESVGDKKLFVVVPIDRVLIPPGF